MGNITKKDKLLKRLQETESPKTDSPDAYLLLRDEEARIAYTNLFKRLSSVLRHTAKFTNAAVELDENAPDFQEKIGEPLEKFFIGVVGTYSGGHGQFDNDLTSLQMLLAQAANAEKIN